MQVRLPADVLVPVGAGVLVVLALLVVVLVVTRRRRRRAAATRAAAAPAESPRPTVAHAVAIREADTAPLPVSSADVLARADAGRATTTAMTTAAAAEPDDAGPSDGGADRPAEEAGQTAVQDEPGSDGADPAPASGTAEPAPTPGTADAVTAPVRTVRRDENDVAGSAQPMAAALARALAQRGAGTAPAQTSDHPVADAPVAPSPTPRPSGGAQAAEPAGGAQAGPQPQAVADQDRPGNPIAPQPRPPAPRGDARDRLLAVLLADPARTLGAAADLEASRVQLSRLTAALTHERGVLEDLIGRLSAAGLEPEQLAPLAGLPPAEVRKLLAP